MELAVRGVLLDIEGTTSAVAYVYDVMFPYARQHAGDYVTANWQSSALANVRRLLASETGEPNVAEDQHALVAAVNGLMDADIKSTGLKELQGLVWQAGFESGALVAHVYDDVPPALRAWHAGELSLRIYSSGSVHAQKLFFGHSQAGNLLPLIDAHYDTTTGPKREAASYTRIAGDWGIAAEQIVFLSDVPAELYAARAAGMQVALVVRPGNAPVANDHDLPVIDSFADLSLTHHTK